MLEILLAPIVGGVIGYITNDLAIKMLFRPRKAIYIGKWHVPFTPGLIPQQKDRIAASIGRVISTQLLNVETIEQTILSEKTKNIIREKLKELLDRFKSDERTVEQILEKNVESDKMRTYKETIQIRGTEFLTKKIEQADIGTQVIQGGIEALDEKMKTGFMSSLKEDLLYKTMEGTIAKVINDVIIQIAPELINKEIGKLEDDILGLPLYKIYDMQQEYIPTLADEVVSFYETAVKANISKVVEVIDIEGIVEEKVRSFDAIQLEQMIFGIMKKELNAIVNLGAILGFFMGFINLLL